MISSGWKDWAAQPSQKAAIQPRSLAATNLDPPCCCLSLACFLPQTTSEKALRKALQQSFPSADISTKKALVKLHVRQMRMHAQACANTCAFACAEQQQLVSLVSTCEPPLPPPLQPLHALLLLLR